MYLTYTLCVKYNTVLSYIDHWLSRVEMVFPKERRNADFNSLWQRRVWKTVKSSRDDFFKQKQS